MESCHPAMALHLWPNLHSVPPSFRTNPSCITIYSTLGHLIHVIEELKNKEKLIAQLEQDLGHQSSYMMQLEKKINTQDKGSSSLTSGPTTPGRTTLTAYNYSPSKDLDGNQQTNLKEHPDQPIKGSKNLSHLIRKADKENSTALAQIRSLQQKVSEQYKTIAALRQACSEKDRRIELIQHRKMKRRLRRSMERSANDDDACSVDSEVSVSSLPMDNGSNEEQLDLWDEYAREEVERNYQQLMREHLELKKSYTLLQAQTASSLDPEREAKLCRALESDLFDAQCKIEELKTLLHSTGLEPRLLEEKETLQAANVEMQKKLKKMEEIEEQLRTELNEAKELIEDLEFRVLELDECQNLSLEDGNDSFGNTPKIKNEEGNDEKPTPTGGVSRSLLLEFNGKDSHISNASHSSDMSSEDEQRLREEVNNLRKQIIELTERPAPEFPLKISPEEEIKERKAKQQEEKLPSSDAHKLLQKYQQQVEELEKTAAELQNKVIALQQEKLKLEQKLNQLSNKDPQEKQNETRGDELSEVQNLEQKNKHADGLDNVNLLDKHTDRQISRQKTPEENEENGICQPSELEKEAVEKITQVQPLNVHQSDNEPEEILTESANKSIEESVQSVDSTVLDSSLQEDKAEIIETEPAEVSSKTEDSWKEIESAIICETIAELEAERDNENMDSAKLKEASLDLLNYPDNNSLLADDVDDENMELLQQQSECLESIKQILSEQGILSHVELMLKEMEEIKEENAMLRDKLAGNSYTLSSGEIINAEFAMERLHQLEEVCENLRNKVHSTEQSEILLKTKLKHAEDTVSELEASESLLKDQLKKISVREAEWKKKAQGLLRSVSELEQLLKEKDAIEEKLNEKIQDLEEAELRNARKLAELREDENDLRESLRSRENYSNDAELSKKLEKMAELERHNEFLRARISELEEAEVLLREHWKQIVDSEANKTECLQEKIKMLESLNKELQSKLQDEEERFATGVSLASELSLSQNLSDSEESRAISEMESKLKEMEDRLYNVTESKNAKIETLEDRVERLQQNEQKLSESIFEMEQREKQLLAKLKLCEHGDFTIEKMLSYEDHIKELSHSQENLLNAFDTLADPESQSQQIISALKSELVNCHRKSDDLCFKERQINEQLKNENNNLKGCLEQSEAREKELSIKIQSLEDENKNLKGLLEEATEPSQNNKQEVTTSSLFIRIQELEAENQELRSKVDDFQNVSRPKSSSSVSLNYERLCELEKENSDLLAEVNKLRDIESQQKVTAEKIRLLEVNEEKLMEKVVELEDSCETQKEELQKLRKDRNDSSKDLIAKLHASEMQLEEEQKRVAELQKLESEARERLTAEEAVNSDLQKQLESLRSKLEEVKQTYADHEMSKEKLEQELVAINHEKELLAKKLQHFNESHIIPDQTIKDHHESSTESEHSSSSSDMSLPLPSSENKYLILIDRLESCLKDIGRNENSDQWLTNESGEILFSPKKFLSKSKLDDSLADPIFEELLQMSQKELAMLIQALQKEMQKKCEKLKDFEKEFMNFSKGIRHSTIIYRDEEVQKTVYTETRTFHKASRNQVPTNEHTTPAGEEETPTKTCKKEELKTEPQQKLPQQKQQHEPKDEMMMDTETMNYVQMPRTEYEAWQAKVAILTDIEANLPNVMESASQLELLLDILQERKNALCSDDKAGISNEELLYYAKLFQTLNESLNGRSAHKGTGAEISDEVLHESEEQSVAKEEVTVPLPKARKRFDTANASERKKLIVQLISNLPSEDLAVAAKALKQNATKRKFLKGGKFTRGLLGKLKKEEEEIEIDMWLSSEDDDDDSKNKEDDVKNDGTKINGGSKVQEAGQNDTDSNLLPKVDIPKPEDIQADDDELKPPLPKTPPPSMPPELLEEPLDTFAKTIDRNVAVTQQNTASTNQQQQTKLADQSEQQVCELTRKLNDKNKYISTLEASIEKLGQLLAQQHGSTHTEEAIKSFEEQLKNLQQELRQHHKEGQQSLTSLRTELQNKSEVKHTTVVQNFQQTQIPKPSPLSHSYSTTDLSKMVSSSPEFETPLKVPHPMRNWASRGHIAPPTFARTIRRRSDTFDPQLLPATHTGGGYMPPTSLWPGEKTMPSKCSNRMFMAASDYDPKLFSASGHPHLELKLKEGDIVQTKGSIGHNGYYEAKVNGKVGLVPAKYLHQLKPETMSSEERRAFRLQFPSEPLDTSPEQKIQPDSWSYFPQSHSASIPKVPGGHPIQPNLKGWNKSISMPRLPGTSTSSAASAAHSGGGQLPKRHSGGSTSHPPTKGLPEAPSNFCLERLVGENSVLLSWQPPVMDELDQNNGMQLIGYRIFLNGRLCQQPGSAHLAKAVVENLDLSRPQYFAIQSVAASGQMSSPAEVVFEGLDRWLDDGASDIGSDTDLSDILPSPHLSLGPRKMYIAIYDYNPSTQSPHDYPDCELRFRAGDHITVYGNERSDGFFWGELNGNRGLVPASFLEEVPLQGTRSKPVSRRGSTASQNSLLQGVGRTGT